MADFSGDCQSIINYWAADLSHSAQTALAATCSKHQRWSCWPAFSCSPARPCWDYTFMFEASWLSAAHSRYRSNDFLHQFKNSFECEFKVYLPHGTPTTSQEICEHKYTLTCCHQCSCYVGSPLEGSSMQWFPQLLDVIHVSGCTNPPSFSSCFTFYMVFSWKHRVAVAKW